MAQGCSVQLLLRLCLPQIHALDLDAHVMVLGGGPGKTLHRESGALRNGVSAITEGPWSPCPYLPVRSTWTRPWPWPQPHLAFSLQNGLLFISLHGCGLLLQQPKGTRALPSLYFCEKGCVCVCVVCICCVLCMCVCGVLCRIRPLTLTFYMDEP